MTDVGLSIVIVNYNGGDRVRRCLGAVWRDLEPTWEVVVVDNASLDGSADGLDSEFSGLQVLRSARNGGFAAGNNLALRHVCGRYVLLLNPDTEVEPGALATALAHLDANPDVGVLGGRILLPDGRADPAAHRSFKTPATYLYKALGLARRFPGHPRLGRYYLSYLDENTVCDVDSVVGAFLMIRRSTIDGIGLLDERFFMYCEDEDWCWRAKKAGWRVVYHPGVVVHHRKGSSTSQHPFRMAYHWHRSLIVYHRKNVASRYPRPVNAAVYAGISMGMVGAFLSAARRRLVGAARA